LCALLGGIGEEFCAFLQLFLQLFKACLLQLFLHASDESLSLKYL